MVLGAKNVETRLLQFPLCKRGDVIDLKMLAMYLSVREDLFSNFVFEHGFHVAKSQTLAAVEAMVVVPEQQEAGNAVAATGAVMPLLLRHGVGLTLPERSSPALAATCLVEAAASSRSNCELLNESD